MHAEFAAISKLGAELHKAKKAERKKNLRLDILEKRLNLSHKILDEELKRNPYARLILGQPLWDRGVKREETRTQPKGNRELERALAKVESDRRRWRSFAAVTLIRNSILSYASLKGLTLIVHSTSLGT